MPHLSFLYNDVGSSGGLVDVRGAVGRFLSVTLE